MKHVQPGDLSAMTYSSQLDILILGFKSGIISCFKLEVESDPSKIAEIREESKMGFEFGSQDLIESKKFY